MPIQLTRNNIQQEITDLDQAIATVGVTIQGLTGYALLHSIKRHQINVGRYQNITLYEAANRLMTDIVILHGVRWLFSYEPFPFDSYSVDFGHYHTQVYDIRATFMEKSLIGESFNAAPSFYSQKTRGTFNKLRVTTDSADYKLIMCNYDAFNGAPPQLGPNEYMLLVDVVGDGTRLVPPTAL
jgi:hypothetical protein